MQVILLASPKTCTLAKHRVAWLITSRSGRKQRIIICNSGIFLSRLWGIGLFTRQPTVQIEAVRCSTVCPCFVAHHLHRTNLFYSVLVCGSFNCRDTNLRCSDTGREPCHARQPGLVDMCPTDEDLLHTCGFSHFSSAVDILAGWTYEVCLLFANASRASFDCRLSCLCISLHRTCRIARQKQHNVWFKVLMLDGWVRLRCQWGCPVGLENGAVSRCPDHSVPMSESRRVPTATKSRKPQDCFCLGCIVRKGKRPWQV